MATFQNTVSAAHTQGPSAIKATIVLAPTIPAAPKPKPKAPGPDLSFVHDIDTGKYRGQFYDSPGAKAGAAFNIVNAGSAARDWYGGGALIGGIAGCAAGALLTAGTAAVACVAYGATWATVGGWTGAGAGFVLGGTNNANSDAFAWGPDQVYPPWKK